MHCPSCHTLNREHAKFCKGCGQALPTTTVDTPSTTREASAEAVEQQVLSPAPEAPETQVVEEPNEQPATDEAQQESVEPSSEAALEEANAYPTQILTPNKMKEYHVRKWERELERERERHGEYAQEQQDIAEAPSAQTPSPKEEMQEPESAEQHIPPQEEPQAEQPQANATQREETQAPSVESLETYAAVPAGTATTTTTEEVIMEQVTPPSDDNQAHTEYEQSQPAEPEITEENPEGLIPPPPPPSAETTEESTTFPVLSIGTVLKERYEVAEVLEITQHEHVYEVLDRQSYRRCWNCGSDKNTEDDDFCMDCGAELRNASYILREFAADMPPIEDTRLNNTMLDTFVENNQTYIIEHQQDLQPAFPNGLALIAACASDAGNLRRGDPNEDSTLVLHLQRVHESIASTAGIFVVADGMGGHDNGQLASRIAISTMANQITQALLLPPLETEQQGQVAEKAESEALDALLNRAVQEANNAIYQVNQKTNTDSGSTMTGFMIVDDYAYILNVGDSRTYMLRDGKLYKLTTDHSLVGQLVAGGLIEPDEVYSHPQRSQIYRSLGDKQNVQVDIIHQQLHPGDILLSCSDGLWEMVRDPQIEEILNRSADPHTACKELIDAANINGGEDNISAVVVFVR